MENTQSAKSSSRNVKRIIVGQRTVEGAGVRLRRTIGLPEIDHLDPFLLLDEFRSDRPEDYQAGFPTHPHRGFETVTYMISGAMKHEDSLGNSGIIGPGDIQWMTAGSGIIHSEMPAQNNGLLWGYQLWVNLPKSDKMCRPKYQDIMSENIPEIQLGDHSAVRIISGEIDGIQGAISDIATNPIYLDISLEQGNSFIYGLSQKHTAFIQAISGQITIGPDAGDSIKNGELAILTDGDTIEAHAIQSSGRFLLIAGSPLNEPVARYGPFVMNTREEIIEAMDDYRQGTLVRHKSQQSETSS